MPCAKHKIRIKTKVPCCNHDEDEEVLHLTADMYKLVFESTTCAHSKFFVINGNKLIHDNIGHEGEVDRGETCIFGLILKRKGLNEDDGFVSVPGSGGFTALDYLLMDTEVHVRRIEKALQGSCTTPIIRYYCAESVDGVDGKRICIRPMKHVSRVFASMSDEERLTRYSSVCRHPKGVYRRKGSDFNFSKGVFELVSTQVVVNFKPIYTKGKGSFVEQLKLDCERRGINRLITKKEDSSLTAALDLSRKPTTFQRIPGKKLDTFLDSFKVTVDLFNLELSDAFRKEFGILVEYFSGG